MKQIARLITAYPKQIRISKSNESNGSCTTTQKGNNCVLWEGHQKGSLLNILSQSNTRLTDLQSTRQDPRWYHRRNTPGCHFSVLHNKQGHNKIYQPKWGLQLCSCVISQLDTWSTHTHGYGSSIFSVTWVSGQWTWHFSTKPSENLCPLSGILWWEKCRNQVSNLIFSLLQFVDLPWISGQSDWFCCSWSRSLFVQWCFAAQQHCNLYFSDKWQKDFCKNYNTLQIVHR